MTEDADTGDILKSDSPLIWWHNVWMLDLNRAKTIDFKAPAWISVTNCWPFERSPKSTRNTLKSMIRLDIDLNSYPRAMKWRKSFFFPLVSSLLLEDKLFGIYPVDSWQTELVISTHERTLEWFGRSNVERSTKMPSERVKEFHPIVSLVWKLNKQTNIYII